MKSNYSSIFACCLAATICLGSGLSVQAQAHDTQLEADLKQSPFKYSRFEYQQFILFADRSRYEDLTPEQRKKIRKRREKFKSLPPEERKKIRKAREKFRKMPPDERRRLREKWEKMTPEERRQHRKNNYQ